MSTKLKVLIVEDSASDTELALHELRRAGYDPEWKRVETEPEYLAQIDQGWEIILADYNLPEFSGLRALELLRERDPDLPLILVSGTIAEDTAVVAMKAGANDYIIKDRMARLGPAVERELREAIGRRERKRAEEALRSEQKMLALTEGIAHVGSWSWNIPTDTVTWSDELFRIFQRDPREGAPSFAEHPAFYHPDDMARLGRAVEAAVAEGTPYELELRAIRKDGETRVCLARGIAEMAPGGRPARLFGSLQDITERKGAEEELRKSEERFKLIFEYAPDAYYLNNLRGVFIDGNKAAENITGYKREELIGGSFLKLKLLSLDQIPKAAKLLVNNAMGKSTGPDEFILRRKDGDKVHVEISTHPVKIENKTVILGIARDITERMQAEKTLRESEGKYRTLVENAAEAIVIAQDGLLKFVNRMASEITGYSEQELLSLPFLDFVHQDDRAMVGEHYVRRLKGDVTLPRYAFRLINKDGSIKWVEIDAVLVTWEGKPATLNFLSDITERKRAEEDLKESENKYRLLAENAQDVIFVLDMNLKYTYVSPSVKILRGYEPEEVLKQQLFEILTPTSMDLAMRALSEIMDLEKSEHRGIPVFRTLQLEMIRKDGSTVWVEVKFSFIRDENQRLGSILGVTRDITERKREIERVRKALGATVQAIAMTVETRDPYTAGHQRRVADLARAIAMEMNLPIDMIDGIRMAAAIHDLGKISVPAEMLSKPTKLTDIEFMIIKTHSQSGYDILKDIDFPWPVGRMVLEHHERINGSGYPNGLTGDKILMESRILSVADVVEAMASHRPYRPALGIEAALAEIEKNKGLLYDPDVVSACLTLFRKQGFRFTENPGL